jgi:hypothetical protein
MAAIPQRALAEVELGRFRAALKRVWPGDGCEV